MLSREKLRKWNGTVVSELASRSPEVVAAYAKLKGEVPSIEEYVRENILGDREYVLAKNAFPYEVDSGIEHFVFWMKPSSVMSMTEVQAIVKKIHPLKEVVVFQNILANQSVAGLAHFQVFVWDV